MFTLQCAQLSKAQSTKLHIMVHILEIPQSLMSQRNPESFFFFFTLNGSIYSENVREDTLLIEKKKEQHRNLNTLNAYANFIIFIGQRDKR